MRGMAMGKRKRERQAMMWVTTTQLTTAASLKRLLVGLLESTEARANEQARQESEHPRHNERNHEDRCEFAPRHAFESRARVVLHQQPPKCD
jgi:hypothetical protein